jgi:4a-hydroxytetrahydrobiopterin dehydratase
VEKLSTQQILGAGLDDWRKLAQALHARYRITDFMAGAAFIAAVAEAAEAASHHPDLKMTDGVVDVSLCTHEDGLWVTQKDIGMARQISQIARQNALEPEPAAVAQLEIALDIADEDGVAPFWSVLLTGSPGNKIYDSVFDPASRVPALWFQGTSDHETPRQRCISTCGSPPRRRRPRSPRAGPSSTIRRLRPSPCLPTRTVTRSASAPALSEAEGIRQGLSWHNDQPPDARTTRSVPPASDG